MWAPDQGRASRSYYSSICVHEAKKLMAHNHIYRLIYARQRKAIIWESFVHIAINLCSSSICHLAFCLRPGLQAIRDNASLWWNQSWKACYFFFECVISFRVHCSPFWPDPLPLRITIQVVAHNKTSRFAHHILMSPSKNVKVFLQKLCKLVKPLLL